MYIPWIAVADLLLSDFCSEVAYELYEMEQPIRNELLKRLRKDECFGKQRIEELSQFLLQYIDQQLRSDDPYIRNFAKSQKWIVNAYTNTNEVARELAEALSARVKENDKGGVIRVAFVPGNELPGYFKLSYGTRPNWIRFPGNELPGYFRLSLRDRKMGDICPRQ